MQKIPKTDSQKKVRKFKKLERLILVEVNSRHKGGTVLAKYLFKNKHLLPKKYREIPFRLLRKSISNYCTKLKKEGFLNRVGLDWSTNPDFPKESLKFLSASDLPLESKTVDLHSKRLIFKVLNPDDREPFPKIVPMRNWYREISEGEIPSPFTAEYVPSTNIFGRGTHGVIIRLKSPSYVGIVKTEQDVDELNNLYDSEIIRCAKQLEKDYNLKLDLDNYIPVLDEAGVKDSFTSQIPPEIRFRNTICKKIYPNKFEFKSILDLKNYVRESGLQQTVPSIARGFDKVTDAIEERNKIAQKEFEMMQGFVSREVARDNTLLVQTQLLKNQNQLLEKMNRPFVVKLWHNVKCVWDGIKRLF